MPVSVRTVVDSRLMASTTPVTITPPPGVSSSMRSPLLKVLLKNCNRNGTIRDEIGIALTASFCSHHDHGAAGRQQLDALALVEGARPC